MADYRQITCAMWRADDWFMDLPIDGKLFWIYLFSNPSASVAGIYRLSLRTMANETGLGIERITELLNLFAHEKKAYFADGLIWVVKMREYQGSESPQVQTKIRKDLALLPKDNPVYRMYAQKYGIDTVSIPDLAKRDETTRDDTIRKETDLSTSIDRQTDTAPGVVGQSSVGQSDPYRLIAATWEQRMGQTVTSSMSQSIREAMRTYGVVTICEAIEAAAEKGNPRWAYVSGILANWQNEGRRNGGPPKPKDNRAPLHQSDPNATEVTYSRTDL